MESIKRSVPTITIIFLLGIITVDVIRQHSIHIDKDVSFYCHQHHSSESQGQVVKVSNQAHHLIWVTCN